jgi:predicted O-methyltransferase YrrM
MALTFHPPRQAVEEALGKLKSDWKVHPDAVFNYDAPGCLRREVTRRDLDFGLRLGRTPLEVEVVGAALDFLKAHGLAPAEASYDKAAFEVLRRDVKERFVGTWTSITPAMERLFYMLTSVHRPKRLIELGCFWGNSLAWFAGPCIGVDKAYEAEEVIGIDVDERMIDLARHNFGKLTDCGRVTLVAEDARDCIGRIPGPFDSLYIEAKSDAEPGMYLILLKAIYDKLRDGAWVVAHDTTEPPMHDELQEYLAWVHDRAHFKESVSFDIDPHGLELSIK